MRIKGARFLLALVLALPILTMSILSRTMSLTGDEALTVFISGEDAGTLLDNVSRDNHPPLYYLMMKGWRQVFGPSLGSLRTFALLPALVIVLLATLFLSPVAGLLLAFSPFLLHLAVELRMYGYLALAGLLVIFALKRDVREHSLSSGALLVLALSAGTWIHHFGWLGVAAAMTVMVMRHRTRRALVCGFLVLLAYSPWIPEAVRQLGVFGGDAMDSSLAYIQAPSLAGRLTGIPFSIGGTLLRFSAGTAGFSFGQFSLRGLDPALFVGAALTGLLVFMAWRGRDRERLPETALFLWVLFSLSLLRPSSRHFALGFTGFAALAAAGFVTVGTWPRRILLTSCLAAMLLFQVRFATEPIMPQRCTFPRDIREAACLAGELAQTEDCPIVANLDHYTSMALLLHLEDEGYGDADVRTPFDANFAAGRYFAEPGEILGYLQHDTDSLVAEWIGRSPVFVLVTNDPSMSRGRILGTGHRFIGMGSDMMADLDLMEVLRSRASVERIPLPNSRGPFSLLMIRQDDRED